MQYSAEAESAKVKKVKVKNVENELVKRNAVTLSPRPHLPLQTQTPCNDFHDNEINDLVLMPLMMMLLLMMMTICTAMETSCMQ